jgi:hypothetical protein
MVVYKKREIASALTKKGFQEVIGSDHTYYYFSVNGIKTPIRTKLSHSDKTEYDDRLLGDIRKQLKFGNKKELIAFIECPRTYEEYVEMLMDGGFLRSLRAVQ